MSYTPHTEAQRREMLRAIGVGSIEALFVDVPTDFRFPQLDLPQPLSEIELLRELAGMASWNASLDQFTSFLGAGAYHHYVPSVVQAITGRSEFYTAYTPYQAEVSQGTLQAMFEYQSMICDLTAMEVANASHYDGGTAVAEAVVMAYNVLRGKRHKAILSPGLHPEYRQVARTYLQGTDVEFAGDEDLNAGLDELEALLDGDTMCLILQTPTFLGELLEPGRLQRLAEAVHQAGALLVMAANPISLGLFVPPGQVGADIVVGEGQPLGNPLNFGGPYLGFFACRKKYVRQLAGRLSGQTVDTEGRRGFVLTLSTREQHIRREKASSNICTNQALNALAAAVYLSCLGSCGLRRVAEICYHRAHYAAERIAQVPGYERVGDGPFFHEFVVRCPVPVADLNDLLLDHGFIGGLDLSQTHPHLERCALFCVTEMVPVDEIDRLVQTLQEVSS
ncbi:MAG: aminomethyl-transferring glycine dehydrogenase subunit GcvPA [Chloroflexia bacterium]|nr:aminomethyl-transferring glycine dehydrogenase subunit GcvPA [Chloroflexia bacterium]